MVRFHRASEQHTYQSPSTIHYDAPEQRDYQAPTHYNPGNFHEDIQQTTSYSQSTSQIRDPKGRVVQIQEQNRGQEHYIRPKDGRVKALRVQGTDAGLSSVGNVPWTRTRLGDTSTLVERVLCWVWAGKIDGGEKGGSVAARWVPGALAMVFLLAIPSRLNGQLRFDGDYDPVRERDRYYTKAARNPCENRPDNDSQRVPLLHHGSGMEDELGTGYEMSTFEDSRPLLKSDGTKAPKVQVQEDGTREGHFRLMTRPLRPRVLCYLVRNENVEDPSRSYEVRPGESNDDPYLFISYTRMTFCVDPSYNAAWAARDRTELLRFAVAATKAAGLSAFWIDFEGVLIDQANTSTGKNDKYKPSDNLSEDVYRICDVLRGASAMVVINGPPTSDKDKRFEENAYRQWLVTWASRLWVLPELLLAPTERQIQVYTQQLDMPPEFIQPRSFNKRDLAAISCADASDVQQLINHYDGNTLLTPLELVQLALTCLRRRKTVSRSTADLAYALKGLLRRRPVTVPNESGFEAFASLSLANDSQRLLERLLCALPPDPNADWSDLRDAWGMELWDFEPSTQVAGIVDDQTVLLDGARGASIRWDKLKRVAFRTRPTFIRTAAAFVTRGLPIFMLMGIITLAIGASFNRSLDSGFGGFSFGDSSGAISTAATPLIVIGVLFFIPAVITLFAAPWLLYWLYHGKFWGTQASFIGIEGPVDLRDLERRLFGIDAGRLSWSANGSLLSRHTFDSRTGECIALPPLQQNIGDAVTGKSNADAVFVPSSSSQNQDGNVVKGRAQRLFTLVDTYTLTVTQFYAFHPPTAVFVTGQEGGMQRGVLCSYDWEKATWARESVVRLKTVCLERMGRVDRVRLRLKR